MARLPSAASCRALSIYREQPSPSKRSLIIWMKSKRECRRSRVSSTLRWVSSSERSKPPRTPSRANRSQRTTSTRTTTSSYWRPTLTSYWTPSLCPAARCSTCVSTSLPTRKARTMASSCSFFRMARRCQLRGTTAAAMTTTSQSHSSSRRKWPKTLNSISRRGCPRIIAISLQLSSRSATKLTAAGST